MINKSIATNDNIVTEAKENEEINTEVFSKRYINIARNKLVIIPKQIQNPSNPNLDAKTATKIIKNFENHPGIIKVKRNIKEIIIFNFAQASTKDINLIITSLNPKKPTGSDGIPIKVI